ncbi:MAG: hypothetical protein G01um10142_359 [Parcubacteria group bacterium Gr01-1014_2]|nr:MAG: hypothetical protein G01um10142_359 [Parcubacteria group bacterium Gr01-1014_2]
MATKYLIALMLILVFVFSVHTFTSINQDIGRHLTLGKIIWETKEVPKTNLFSYTNPDFPFINHHWFGEVLLYLSSLLVGLKGLIILKAFMISIAFALAFFAVFKKEQILPAVIAGLISIFILIERTDVRPEIFSFLFLGWYLFVLFKQQDEFSILPTPPKQLRLRRPGNFQFSKYLLWTLPLVQLIWVNTHIYFFLGPLIFFLFFIGEWVKERKFPSGLLLLGLAVGLVNFISPFGWQGALYPLFVFNNYGYSIIENQGPFFLKAWGYPWLTTYALFTGIAFVAVSFLANIKNFKRNIFGFFLFVVAVILSLKMVRNYPIFALTMLPISIKNFLETGIEFKSHKSFLSAAAFILILIFSVITDQIYEEANLGRRFGLVIPQGVQKAVDFVRQNNLRGPIFNNFDVGSFLIWKLPEEKVFIDGRPEAYPADFIQNVYIPMQEEPDLWTKYSKEYGINYVFWLYSDITPWSQKFVSFMLQNPSWPLVYRDGSVMIFVRK